MPGDLPFLYHTHHSFYQEDIPFWQSLASQQGGFTLELGCGGGRVLRPLAESGHKIIGLDRDPEMLAILRAGYPEDFQAKVPVFQADMNYFRLDSVFNLIFMACNTLSALPDDERPRVFRRIAGHLASDGLFVASLPNPAALLALETTGDPEVELEFAHPLTGNPVQASSAWVREGSRVEMRWSYDHLLPDGNVERSTAVVSHSLAPAEQYVQEMAAAGLQVLGLHGDYDHSSYGKDAPYLILRGAL